MMGGLTGRHGRGAGLADVAQRALSAAALKLTLKGLAGQVAQAPVLFGGEKFRGAVGGDGHPDNAAG